MKNLLATMAMAMSLALPAAGHGQSGGGTSGSNGETAAPSSTIQASRGTATFLRGAADEDVLASTLIGTPVYASPSLIDESRTYPADARSDWENIGEITDVVLHWDGSVKAILLGVGGFLGIGEKAVAVEMSGLYRVREAIDSTDWSLVVNADRQSLESAPDYLEEER